MNVTSRVRCCLWDGLWKTRPGCTDIGARLCGLSFARPWRHINIPRYASRISSPQSFPETGFQVIEPSKAIEEETLISYDARKYYPVHIGEVFHDRYQVVGKVGFGVTSTVWLARDLMGSGYVSLKMYVNDSTGIHELDIYDRINSVKSGHKGKNYVRKLLGTFDVAGPHGKHTCIVHQPLGVSLDQLVGFFPTKKLTLELMKPCLRRLLLAIDFLHTDAHIIHTDLQLKNLLLGADDDTLFTSFEEAEFKKPTPRKFLEDRTIYESRSMSVSNRSLPYICDFGEARFGEEEHREDIMPDLYRAPEVLLKLNWDYKVDIWNLAMVAWDMVSRTHLFHARGPENELNDTVHLSEMIALMGPPPSNILYRSKKSHKYWDANGNWRTGVPIPNVGLDDKVSASVDGEDKEGFLRLLRRMLRWAPEERPPARELIQDPWFGGSS